MGALFADAIARDAFPEKYPYPEADAPAKYVRMFLRATGVAPAPAAGPEAAGAAAAGGTLKAGPNLS